MKSEGPLKPKKPIDWSKVPIEDISWVDMPGKYKPGSAPKGPSGVSKEGATEELDEQYLLLEVKRKLLNSTRKDLANIYYNENKIPINDPDSWEAIKLALSSSDKNDLITTIEIWEKWLKNPARPKSQKLARGYLKTLGEVMEIPEKKKKGGSPTSTPSEAAPTVPPEHSAYAPQPTSEPAQSVKEKKDELLKKFGEGERGQENLEIISLSKEEIEKEIIEKLAPILKEENSRLEGVKIKPEKNKFNLEIKISKKKFALRWNVVINAIIANEGDKIKLENHSYGGDKAAISQAKEKIEPKINDLIPSLTKILNERYSNRIQTIQIKGESLEIGLRKESVTAGTPENTEPTREDEEPAPEVSTTPDSSTSPDEQKEPAPLETSPVSPDPEAPKTASRVSVIMPGEKRPEFIDVKKVRPSSPADEPKSTEENDMSDDKNEKEATIPETSEPVTPEIVPEVKPEEPTLVGKEEKKEVIISKEELIDEIKKELAPVLEFLEKKMMIVLNKKDGIKVDVDGRMQPEIKINLMEQASDRELTIMMFFNNDDGSPTQILYEGSHLIKNMLKNSPHVDFEKSLKNIAQKIGKMEWNNGKLEIIFSQK